ncbi:MAG: hypothetical protein K5838_01645 [Elusimicrobiales bacterium]|nr:hypothetical protein [Elusimicrobiales bacterium]
MRQKVFSKKSPIARIATAGGQPDLLNLKRMFFTDCFAATAPCNDILLFANNAYVQHSIYLAILLQIIPIINKLTKSKILCQAAEIFFLALFMKPLIKQLKILY